MKDKSLETGKPPPEREARLAHISMIEVLRDTARKRCNRRNCGSVCLCIRCHAKRALAYYDPGWNK